MLGTHLTPKLSLWPSKTLVDKIFVKWFTRFFWEMIFSMDTSLFITISCINWYFFLMCLSFQWFFGSLDYAIIPLLSQNNTRDNTAKGTIPSPIRNFRSQKTSFVASETIIYSTSIMKSTIYDCFTLLQLITLPPKLNTNPKVDLRKFLPDWKFEFVYSRDNNLMQWYTNI